MECNRGHIIYKTVPLLTHCTCSIPQRMNSPAKFIPQPTTEFMFEAIFCKTVFMLPTYTLRNRSFNSLISKCAVFSKEKCLYLSSLTPLEHRRVLIQHCPSKDSLQPHHPYSTIQAQLHHLSASLCPSTNRCYMLFTETQISTTLLL